MLTKLKKHLGESIIIAAIIIVGAISIGYLLYKENNSEQEAKKHFYVQCQKSLKPFQCNHIWAQSKDVQIEYYEYLTKR